jgi:hypothetical protein
MEANNIGEPRLKVRWWLKEIRDKPPENSQVGTFLLHRKKYVEIGSTEDVRVVRG